LDVEAPEQQVVLVPVPELTVVKLPRCPNPDCPDPVHPLARAGSFDPSVCPGCGGPASEPCDRQDVEPLIAPQFLDQLQVYIGKPRDET
jgi:hypothetical protein